MDDNKKKKNNKKRKNKNANRSVENVTVDEKELNPMALSQSGQDSDSKVSVNSDAGWDGHHPNGTEEKELPKNEAQNWLDREALLEARINQLLKEKDDFHKKETAHKEEIQQLYDEKNAFIEREASLNETVIKLNRETDALILKQGILEHTIQQLQREIDVHQQKSNSDKVSIADLTNHNTILLAKVIGLEHSRDNLIKLKQQLTGIISSLESKIKVLEGSAVSQNSVVHKNMTCEDVDLDHKIQSSDAKFQNSSENREKVCREANVNQPIDYDTHDGSSVGGHVSEDSKVIPFSTSTQSLEDVLLEDEDIKHSNDKFCNSNEIQEVDEDNIARVPSKEGEVQKSEWEGGMKNEVPLTEAPLIGAPFRFISFFARYVSGADLVGNTGKK